jgi:hypothetical protein
MNVIMSIGRCDYLLPQADALKIMAAMSKAIEVDKKYSGEWENRRDYRTRYVTQRRRSSITITEVDQDQIIIPPEMADEVSPAPRRKIRKQIGKPIPQLPFTP